MVALILMTTTTTTTTKQSVKALCLVRNSSSFNSSSFSSISTIRVRRRRGAVELCIGGVRERSSSSSSTYSSSSSPSIATTEGVVQGVWIFARHGDRTPSRSICAPHRKEEEAAFWRTRLPSPDPVTAFKILSDHFPPDIHPSNAGKFLDVERRPYGFLTTLGVEQLKTNGLLFSARYHQLGHHCPSTGAEPFLHSWDVNAFSTNYLRTVLSVQCFLDGLLGTDCYTPLGSHHTIELDDDVSRLVPNHHSFLPSEDSKARVQVQVRDRACDNLNAFDRNPQLIKNLVRNVASTTDFIAQDGAAAPLAARLANYLPGLVRHGVKTFGGPSGINWIEATDHFVCRRSHGVKLSRFTNHEDNADTEGILAAMEHQTMRHLAWRFRQWYQSPPLLAEIASPALREVLEQMQVTVDLPVDKRHPFTIFSCHDVTILSLLYGLGADFLADEAKGGWRFWPTYGTTLVLELVRIQNDQGMTSHIVRILINGTPVRAVNLLDHTQGQDLEYVGTGPEKMLTLADFGHIVTKLEQAGGMPHEILPIEDAGLQSQGSLIKGESG